MEVYKLYDESEFVGGLVCRGLIGGAGCGKNEDGCNHENAEDI
jgi:hypothetical protein